MSASGPLRVGFVIDALTPGAGTENQLILMLRGFDRSRIEPHLCVLHDRAEGLASLNLGVETTVLGFHRLRSPAGLRGMLRLRRWVREHRLQVLKTFFRDAGIVGALGSRGLGVPVVAGRRNLGKGYWHTSSELRLARFVNRFISGWVANSEAVRRYTIEAERVPPEQITVIPNALDLIRFHPRELGVDLARERTRLGLPQGLLFVVVANLRPIKGVDVALEGFAAVAGQTGGAQLILVGEGEEESRLRSRVGALGLQSRVTFLGSREDVPDILRLADVGMLTSRGEGSSNAILEYAASGLPVVATAVGGTPEWVTAADCGRLAPSEDAAALGAALLELAADSDLRRELGGKGRRYVERNHGVEPTLARWVEFLSSMA